MQPQGEQRSPSNREGAQSQGEQSHCNAQEESNRPEPIEVEDEDMIQPPEPVFPMTPEATPSMHIDEQSTEIVEASDSATDRTLRAWYERDKAIPEPPGQQQKKPRHMTSSQIEVDERPEAQVHSRPPSDIGSVSPNTSHP